VLLVDFIDAQSKFIAPRDDMHFPSPQCLARSIFDAASIAAILVRRRNSGISDCAVGTLRWCKPTTRRGGGQNSGVAATLNDHGPFATAPDYP
jgi:hypothetical protein